MKKAIVNAAMAATIGICVSAHAQFENGSLLPYGNLGLNRATDEVVEVQTTVNEETGFKPFFDYYAVVVSNPYGGASQATNYTHEMIFGATGDLEKAIGWKGAKIVVSGAYNAGGDLANSIGNYFSPSESAVVDGGMFYELYLAQTIDTRWGDSFTVRIGRLAMGDTFNTLPVFGYLVSGALDCSPYSMYTNSPFTSSPIATWGVNVQYNTVENLSFAAGVYQIPQNVESPNWTGTDWHIQSNDGYMAMFQATWSPSFFGDSDGNGGLSGEYQIGVWFYGGFEMPYLDGTGGSRGNGYGFYVQGQQQVWVDENNENKYVAVWCGAQYAPLESIATMPLMIYAGVQLQGFVPQREQDGIYASFTGGWFSSDLNSVQQATYETVVELTYVIQLNENISIQPDFQYIMRPYGNSNIDDAMVLGGQLLVSF